MERNSIICWHKTRFQCELLFGWTNQNNKSQNHEAIELYNSNWKCYLKHSTLNCRYWHVNKKKIQWRHRRADHVFSWSNKLNTTLCQLRSLIQINSSVITIQMSKVFTRNWTWGVKILQFTRVTVMKQKINKDKALA